MNWILPLWLCSGVTLASAYRGSERREGVFLVKGVVPMSLLWSPTLTPHKGNAGKKNQKRQAVCTPGSTLHLTTQNQSQLIATDTSSFFKLPLRKFEQTASKISYRVASIQKKTPAPQPQRRMVRSEKPCSSMLQHRSEKLHCYMLQRRIMTCWLTLQTDAFYSSISL